jgi:hypothetical protein
MTLRILEEDPLPFESGEKRIRQAWVAVNPGLPSDIPNNSCAELRRSFYPLSCLGGKQAEDHADKNWVAARKSFS